MLEFCRSWHLRCPSFFEAASVAASRYDPSNLIALQAETPISRRRTPRPSTSPLVRHHRMSSETRPLSAACGDSRDLPLAMLLFYHVCSIHLGEFCTVGASGMAQAPRLLNFGDVWSRTVVRRRHSKVTHRLGSLRFICSPSEICVLIFVIPYGLTVTLPGLFVRFARSTSRHARCVS